MASVSKTRAVKTGKSSSKERVGAHRKRLRARGLRPVQIWLPDTRAPGFAKEARRQARLAARSIGAADDQAFVDAISEFEAR